MWHVLFDSPTQKPTKKKTEKKGKTEKKKSEEVPLKTMQMRRKGPISHLKKQRKEKHFPKTYGESSWKEEGWQKQREQASKEEGKEGPIS